MDNGPPIGARSSYAPVPSAFVVFQGLLGDWGEVMPRTSKRYRHRRSKKCVCSLSATCAEPSPRQAPPVDESPPRRQGDGRRVVHFPGGGKFFFWQSGVSAYLREAGLLDHAQLIGVSAGALTAALAVCDVDAKHAVTVAIRLLQQARVWERPLGLVGVWGGVVRAWLDELLPPDAHTICSHKVTVTVLRLWPWGKRVHVGEFVDREDLVQALLASCHLPLVMDGRLCCCWRGMWCVDGSIGAPRTATHGSMPPHLLEGAKEVWTLDYLHDEGLASAAIDFMALATPQGLHQLIDLGYSYAHRRFHKQPTPLLDPSEAEETVGQ